MLPTMHIHHTACTHALTHALLLPMLAHCPHTHATHHTCMPPSHLPTTHACTSPTIPSHLPPTPPCMPPSLHACSLHPPHIPPHPPCPHPPHTCMPPSCLPATHA